MRTEKYEIRKYFSIIVVCACRKVKTKRKVKTFHIREKNNKILVWLVKVKKEMVSINMVSISILKTF